MAIVAINSAECCVYSELGRINLSTSKCWQNMNSLCSTGSWKLFNQQWTVRSPMKRVRGIESHPFNSFLSECILMKWFQTLWLCVSWMAKCPLLLVRFYSDQKIRLFWLSPVFDSEHCIWNFPIWMRVIPNFSKHLLVHSNTVPVMILCILLFFNFDNSILIIPAWLDLEKQTLL